MRSGNCISRQYRLWWCKDPLYFHSTTNTTLTPPAGYTCQTCQNTYKHISNHKWSRILHIKILLAKTRALVLAVNKSLAAYNVLSRSFFLSWTKTFRNTSLKLFLSLGCIAQEVKHTKFVKEFQRKLRHSQTCIFNLL